MVLHELYNHNDTWYKVLRKMPSHNFENQNQVVNMELLKAWRDYLGGDHVLRVQNSFWVCQTVEDAQIIEQPNPEHFYAG